MQIDTHFSTFDDKPTTNRSTTRYPSLLEQLERSAEALRKHTLGIGYLKPAKSEVQSLAKWYRFVKAEGEVRFVKPQDSWELEDVHDVHGWGDKRGCLCDTLNKSTVKKSRSV